MPNAVEIFRRVIGFAVPKIMCIIWPVLLAKAVSVSFLQAKSLLSKTIKFYVKLTIVNLSMAKTVVKKVEVRVYYLSLKYLLYIKHQIKLIANFFYWFFVEFYYRNMNWAYHPADFTINFTREFNLFCFN